MSTLSELMWGLQQLEERQEVEPLELMAWLPHQVRTLQNTGRFRLLRTGNQLGKTTVGLAEIIFAAIGEHPYRTPSRKHSEYWVVCASWSQSLAIQKKLYELCPKDLLHPDTKYDVKRGFRGTTPAVQLLHADGGWSTIRIKTTKQEGLDLAGDTLSGVLFDEPPKSQRIYTEVTKRLQSTGGWLLCTMTPINAPVGWLRELCEQGKIEDIHARLTPEAMIPDGKSEPIRQVSQDGKIIVCDADWVEEVIWLTPDHEVPVTCHGEWETKVGDAYFSKVWRRPVHVDPQAPQVEVLLIVGVDHGDRPGKQVALLVCVDPDDPVGSGYGRPGVYVLDEYVDWTGVADSDVDARGILSMLRKYGWSWEDLDEARGDRAHMPGTGRQKSCRDLQAALGRELTLPSDRVFPRIITTKRGEGRGQGSLDTGLRWLHAQFARDLIRISPRCIRLIEAMEGYRRAPKDEHADPIDALRYALDRWIFARASRGAQPDLRVS